MAIDLHPTGLPEGVDLTITFGPSSRLTCHTPVAPLNTETFRVSSGADFISRQAAPNRTGQQRWDANPTTTPPAQSNAHQPVAAARGNERTPQGAGRAPQPPAPRSGRHHRPTPRIYSAPAPTLTQARAGRHRVETPGTRRVAEILAAHGLSLEP